MYSALKFIFVSALLIFTLNAQAYFSTFDTNNTIEAGNHKLGLEGQYIFNNIQGGNIVAHYNYGLGEGQEFKAVLGAGIVNFQLGGFYKVVPIPDTESQPAIGGFVGLLISNVSGQTVVGARIHPMISKIFKFNDNHSTVTPYAALPLGISFGNGSTTVPLQLALGADWVPPFLENAHLITEVGFNINSAFSYFSAGLNVPFETFDDFKL